MYRKKTLFVLALLLVLEAVIIVALPSRMPRPARAITGAVNLLLAVVVFVLARRKK
jgi:hypothetical protein